MDKEDLGWALGFSLATIILLPILAVMVSLFWLLELIIPYSWRMSVQEKERYSILMLEKGKEIDIVTGKRVG